MPAVCSNFGLREQHHRKKSSFFDGSRELLRRIWLKTGSEMGMELGSRFRVPDSDSVLVREAMRRILANWADGFLKIAEEDADIVFPP